MSSKSNNFEDLNYDCNYNLFLAKSLIPHLEEQKARQKAMGWLKKLVHSNRTIDEMKLRNDFLYHLVLNINNGKLEPPFDKNPPSGPLTAIAQLLPGGGANVQHNTFGGDIAQQNILPAGTGVMGKTERPMVDQSSPDGGAFLSSQPIPKCGAFCYLAVMSKPRPVEYEAE
ncbi:uncharacterized protein LOC106669808 [Cimex lectularius]|uniref:DUF4485 domain-containing protein n=1 Tax=Cimex lectularius TaxID=79782 RepID=A0A8I6RZ54_CIMLE|nr:uncharacterized protein LOC106669808 [Cimex lectularius]